MPGPIPSIAVPAHLARDAALQGLIEAFGSAALACDTDPSPGGVAETRWRRAFDRAADRAGAALREALLAHGEAPDWVEQFLADCRGLNARWPGWWKRLTARVGTVSQPLPAPRPTIPVSPETRAWLAAKVAAEQEAIGRDRAAGRAPSALRLQWLALHERLLAEAVPPPPDRPAAPS